MVTYLLERVGRSLLVLLGVILVAYLLVLLTGDPAGAIAGPDASPADVERVRRELGYDQPLPIQMVRYVWKVLQGDFGRSSTYRQAAFPLILERLPATLALAAAAMLVNLVIALPLGVLSAVRRGGVVDVLGTLVVFAGQSMPVFWMGIMLILLLSLTLQILPASGYGWPNVVMPAFVLGIHGAAYQTRLLRSAMLDVLSQDYLRTARAKGLLEQAVVVRHALRNALIPVITASGIQFAVLMGGAVIVETVFAWPGVGSLAVSAINGRDVSLVVASTFVFAVFILAVNLLVDLSYGLVDPRVRLT
ncbi:MAG: ABC transporter permease [Chloroflexi bacterium]|nr:ABC transporter permease [Chloroflexota bacterium]